MTAEIRHMLGRASASGDADAMLQAGAAALQAGVHGETVGQVKTVLTKHPENFRLWQLLGLLYRGLEDLEPAVEAFAKAARLAPDDAMIAHGHACVCLEAGLPAANLFEKAIRLAPNDRAIVLRHAAAKIREGHGPAAIAALERELLRAPDWIEGHSALARLRWASGDRDNFMDSFERALRVLPRNVLLWTASIEALLHDKLHERAISLINRARSAAGNHPSFDAAEAICRSELGDLKAAGLLFARVAHLNDVNVVTHYLRFLLRSGRVGEAADIAAKSAPRDPTNQIWPYLAISSRLLGDPRWEWLEGDPRLIGVYDISERLPPLDKLAEHLRTLHRSIQQPLDQSLRGGTQTDGQLFPRIDPEIQKLRQAVVEAVEKHVAQLPPPQSGHPLLVQRRGPIRFSGSWSVRLTGGGRHVNHYHPAGWISSALYVSLPDEGERGGGEAGWLSLGEATELGIDLPPIRLVEPKPGRLVLFPSTMWHGTRPFEAGERLTVAFDVKRPG